MSLHGSDPEPAVLVIGAGLAGMTTAHHLAEWGAQVYLADHGPHLGGAFLVLDRTFATDSCGLCIGLPRQPSYCPTIASELHPRITLMPSTTLIALEGVSGSFVARLCHASRYVDPYLCDHCGACSAVCPVSGSRSGWDRRLHEDLKQRAIYPPVPRAVPFAYAVDPDLCTRCGACVDVCPQGAIDLEAMPTGEAIEVGAVVLSPGFVPFDPARAVEYGWGRYANVVSSLEFECMLNRSGPTGGRPLRLSDRQPPRRIAFVQCVGSRSEKLARLYCSTSCCMITAKQVRLLKEVAPETGVTVFSMDIRAVGKGYERYFQRMATLPGVSYRWGLPAAVHEMPEERSLRVPAPDGEEPFDLVVLAVGVGPSDDMRELAACAGVGLDEYGFVQPGDEGPGSTTRRGVFAAGSVLGPADVPETVTQATAAAALAAAALPSISAPGSSSPHQWQEEGKPVELLDQPPRVGLFLCNCRGTLEGMLDLGGLSARAKRLRTVAHVEQLTNACEDLGLSTIERAVAEHDLNRIVVAGCSPRLYAARFDALMDRLHLPRRLLARADIREGAAWAHTGDPVATTAALGELAMAVAGLREAPYSPLRVRPQENTARRVLVLGGGLAGMTAALTLAALGVECDLVERQTQLGGILRESTYALEGLNVQALLTEAAARVQQMDGVRVWTRAELASWSGVRGDFAAELRVGDEAFSRSVGDRVHRERYGALIIATGARQVEPREYLYGQDDRVLTQRGLESLLADPQSPIGDLRSVAMIQCVGSRDEIHPYCSRVCCTQAVRNALVLKERNPSAEVSIFFRDMCTMGTDERYYHQARRLGVLFVQYDAIKKPRVQVTDSSAGRSDAAVPQLGTRLQVVAWDAVLNEEIALYPELVVLSAGIEPGVDSQDLARLIGVPLDEDGFFTEAHAKLRPTDLARPGIFVCGMAYGPRTIEESITQARAAALRAGLTVARPAPPRHDVATVVKTLCSYCGLCVAHCPYGARVLDDEARYADVIDHLCQGCGMCVAICPNGASRQSALQAAQVLALVDEAVLG